MCKCYQVMVLLNDFKQQEEMWKGVVMSSLENFCL